MNDVEEVFAGETASVARVRAWAGEFFAARGVAPCVVAEAVLVLSELASNAVQHTRSGGPLGNYLVRLQHSGRRLRVEVTDAGGATVPRPRRGEPGPYAESGRGLALVAALAKRVRVTGGRRGRTITAELAPTRQTPASTAGKERR